ncbi:MAG TPA: hypothetical protein VF746_31080 [Longimicrobium sp.]
MSRATALLLALQLTGSALMLTFGLACLRVARRPGLTLRAGGWFLTGATFAAIGAIATFQNVWAIWAVVEGAGSGVYRAFMAVTPVLNTPRSIATVGYSAALVALVFTRRPFPAPRQVAAGLLALLAAGALLGWARVDPTRQDLLWLLALLDATSLLLLLAALYRALVTDAFDYLLWAAIAIYAARVAITFYFFSMMTLTSWWRPSAHLSQLVAVVSGLLMIACTLHRIGLERAGREVPTFMGRVAR